MSMERRPAWRRTFRLGVRILTVVLVGLPVFVGTATATGLGALVFGDLAGSIPDAKETRQLQPSHVYMMSADGTRGEEVHQFRRFELALPMKREDVPQVLKDALVAAEDRQFWSHKGIDPYGIARAAYVDATAGSTRQGASTITQQVVREKYLSREQTIERKFNEVLLATRYERDLIEQIKRETDLEGDHAEHEAKERIIFEYLSTMYFGSGAYGASAAAETYFRKHVRDLTASEAATIIGILPSPTAYSPRENVVLAEEHRRTVLAAMHDLNMLDDIDYDDAMSQSLWWSGFGPPPKPSAVLYPAPQNEFQRYPYFLSYVKEYLEKKYGPDQLYQGGLEVYLSLDPRLQAAAEASVAHEMRNTRSPLEMSLVSLDPATGMVKALVGGRDYHGDYKGAQVNLALGKFPPGSSFKAFTAAASLEIGRPASKRLYAPEVLYKPGCRGSCEIKNAAAGESGNWDLSTAMGMSINTWFVNLIDEIGFNRVVDLVHRFGMNPLPGENGFNHQLTLGKNETSPLEMASGYGIFANRGVRAAPTPVAKVVRADGVVLEDNSQPQGTPVLNPIVADWMSEVLRTPIEKGTATGTVKLDRMAVGKTGTVDGHSNAWFVGYVPQLATAVWIGHSDGLHTIYVPGEGEVYGAGPPARAWNSFMNQALAGVPVVNFNPPEPLPPPEQIAVPLPGEQLVTEEVRRPPARTPGIKSIPEDCGGPCVVNPAVQAPQAPAPAPRTTARPPTSAAATTVPTAPTAPTGGGSP